MVLSLEVTNSWKYDRRELKKLIMGEIYDILSRRSLINFIESHRNYHKN